MHLKDAEAIIKKQTAELLQAKENGDAQREDELVMGLNKSQSELKKAEAKIAELENQLQEKPIATVTEEKIPDEVLEELEALRIQVKENTGTGGKDKSIIKLGVQFDATVKSFNELLATLDEVTAAVPDEGMRYARAINNMLEKMQSVLVIGE